ncbi:MAG TPA: hypothetical protein PK878_05890 [bacterium]|nr:hypothetical protein [bacterium]HOL93068.1 hypothetical protein [bacterium]HPP02233.1 hypothetical protein [bacterium]HXK95729.1 hypothetical protein [bacterium]
MNCIHLLLCVIFSMPVVQPIDADFKESTVTAIVHHENTNEWGIVRRSAQGEDLKLYFVSRTPIYQPAWAFDRCYLTFLVAGHTAEVASQENGDIESIRDKGQALVIMNEKYHITATFPDVRAYCWSPFNYKLIAINGRYEEGGQGYKSRMTFLYDAWQQMGITLYFQADKAFWARKDELVYLYSVGNPVRAYDPYKNVMADTGFQGIHIDPSGRFYYADIPELDFRVYNAKTHEPVVLPTDLNENRLAPVGWLDAREPVLILRELLENLTVLFNVRTGMHVLKPWLPLAPRGGYLPAEFVDTNQPVRVNGEVWGILRGESP